MAVALTIVGMPPAPISSGESLERFGTVSFGIDTMHRMIEIDRFVGGKISAVTWWEFVPLTYRDDVHQLLQEVFMQHRGERLSEATLYDFVVDLHRAILRGVQPR